MLFSGRSYAWPIANFFGYLSKTKARQRQGYSNEYFKNLEKICDLKKGRNKRNTHTKLKYLFLDCDKKNLQKCDVLSKNQAKDFKYRSTTWAITTLLIECNRNDVDLESMCFNNLRIKNVF